MIGLMEKDVRLTFSNKKVLCIFVFALALAAMNDGFILWYFPFLAVFMVFGTLTNDEMDNGRTFLFTLPVDVKTYVQEKYLLALITFALSYGLALVLYYAVGMVSGATVAAPGEDTYGLLTGLLVFLSITIPTSLKFGREKGMVIMLVMSGVIVLGAKLLSSTDLGDSVVKALSWFLKLQQEMQFGLVIGLVVVILVVSYVCSVQIMKKKEW